MVTTNALMKVAGIGGLLTAGMGYTYFFGIRRNIRKTAVYKEAIERLESHPKAVKWLGDPIKAGHIHLGENANQIRYFTVAIKGSNTNGKLYCEFEKDIETQISQISFLKVSFDNLPGRAYVLKDKSVTK